MCIATYTVLLSYRLSLSGQRSPRRYSSSTEVPERWIYKWMYKVTAVRRTEYTRDGVQGRHGQVSGWMQRSADHLRVMMMQAQAQCDDDHRQ